MPLTLVEAAKQSQNPIQSAIMEMYAMSSDTLMALPFQNIQGNALKYNREETLPGIGFRGVNEAYTESTGILNPQVEPLAIAGGDLDVDKFILSTMGQGQRAVQEKMKVKALAGAWTKAFYKGDSASDVREFDGLQTRLTGDQLIENGTTDGGDALSLAKLDEAIDACENPTHLAMNKAMRRIITAAGRLATVGGYVEHEKNAFGENFMIYNGLPVLIVDYDEAGDLILDFDEVGSGGSTATATSIYVISFGSDRITGIQNGPLMATDLGELQTKPALRTRVEWYAGLAAMHGKSAVRLRGIKSGAATV
jgi:hypothetical protein